MISELVARRLNLSRKELVLQKELGIVTQSKYRKSKASIFKKAKRVMRLNLSICYDRWQERTSTGDEGKANVGVRATGKECGEGAAWPCLEGADESGDALERNGPRRISAALVRRSRRKRTYRGTQLRGHVQKVLWGRNAVNEYVLGGAQSGRVEEHGMERNGRRTEAIPTERDQDRGRSRGYKKAPAHGSAA